MNIQPKNNTWDDITHHKLRIKPNIKMRRHQHRGVISYVLEDMLTSQRYSFSSDAYIIVGRLTWEFSIKDIFNHLTETQSTTKINKEYFLQVLQQLTQLGALSTPLPKELTTHVIKRAEVQTNLLSQVKKSPLFLKIPLLNPSRVLQRYSKYVQPLYSKTLLVFLTILFALALAQLIITWPDLTNNALDRIFTRHNLFILWVIYPIVKTVHEFAHAFTVKYYGGNVTEMGFMFLLFMPVPYVNASAFCGIYKQMAKNCGKWVWNNCRANPCFCGFNSLACGRAWALANHSIQYCFDLWLFYSCI